MPEPYSVKNIGELGESAAVRYLENQGYRIVTRNFRSKGGEIDIVACDGTYTVFVEVKSRSFSPGSRYGRASSAVDYAKRQRFLSAVRDYQKKYPGSVRCRIDVIEVYFLRGSFLSDCEIHHIKSAF